MGYRSDVAIKIYGPKEKVTQLKEFADAEYAKLSDETQGYVDSMIRDSEETVDESLWNFDDEENSVFFFLSEHSKWYDGTPCVDYINSIFNKAKELGEEDELIQGEYVRIGEELDDNEVDRFNVDDYPELSISRTIEY